MDTSRIEEVKTPQHDGTPRSRLPLVEVRLARELPHQLHVVLARERVDGAPRGELGDLLLTEPLFRLEALRSLFVPFPHPLHERVALLQVLIQGVVLPLGFRVHDLLRALRSTFLLLS